MLEGAGGLRVHTASLFLGPRPSAAVPATATTRHRSLSGHSQDRGTHAGGVGRAAPLYFFSDLLVFVELTEGFDEY